MAKKKRKRGPGGPSGVDPNERRRERLEARRQAKAAAEAARYRAERRARLTRRVITILAATALVWFFFLRSSTPSEIQGHPIRSFAVQGAGEHIQGDEIVSYESTPPVSGRHAPTPAPCGFYGEPLPNADVGDEMLVHTLEHGAVAVLYSPELPADEVTQLEGLVGDYEDDVLVAPYEGMEPVIAVASWGHMMELDELDLPAVREYIDVFRESSIAPESGQQDCPTGVEQPFQPEASPSPGPSPSPTGGGGGGNDNGGGKDGGGGNGGGGGKNGGGNNGGGNNGGGGGG